jgi:hypothetical protein
VTTNKSRCAIGLLALATAGILSAQDAGIEGSVINSVTRQPLEGVHVRMYVPRAGPPEETYGAISRPNGHFFIANMRAAKYGFSAQLNGFVHLEKTDQGPRPGQLAFSAGEHKTGFIIEMTPVAVISGRVIDEYGDPVENASVSAEDTSSRPGGLRLFVLSRMHSRTDERGQFRIVGAPGKFYVSASKDWTEVAQNEIRTDGSESPVYGKTWHPQSESKDHAVPVQATAGTETAGIDIRLVRKRSLTISGVVTGTPAGSTRADVFLRTKYYGLGPYQPDADGRFALSALAPGHYTLAARYETAGAPMISQTVDVQLDNADDNGVSLKLVPGEEVSGTLEVEGEPADRRAKAKRTVRLAPIRQVNAVWVEVNGGEVDQEGTFRITPIYPGKFRVSVDQMPENGFIKSVQADGEPASDGVVDLSRGVDAAKLKVTIGLNGGQIEGRLSAEGGESSPVRGATIVLADGLDEIGNRNRTSVDAGKRYRVSGLHPGKYRFIVVDSTQEFSTESLEAMYPKAPEIEVREGDRITRDVRIAAKEKPHANP